MELYGIAEAPGLLHAPHFEGTRSAFPVLAEGEDLVEHVVERHRQLGVANVIWQLGRTWVTYHTDHPLLTVQGSITRQENLTGELEPNHRQWLEYLEGSCPLRRALDAAARRDLGRWGWLCMNRHYGEGCGKLLISRFWRDQRAEMAEYHKDGSRDMSRLCYAFPEYRNERLAAVLEAARARGYETGAALEVIVLDFVRQPPILLYHPALCDPYEAAAGRDPRQIQAQEVEPFLHWCQWRADVLTGFLRQVRAGLKSLAAETGRDTQLAVRVTDLGPNVNLIEGCDVTTWCAEGLIDALVTSPLNWARTVWEHDLRPYVSMGQSCGIPVIAGVCLNQQTRFHGNGASVNYAVLARRVHEYHSQGADGIALYQSECGLEFDGIEQVVPRFASRQATADLLRDEAFQAAWPVTHLDCAYGLDCHSHFNNYTIDGSVSPM